MLTNPGQPIVSAPTGSMAETWPAWQDGQDGQVKRQREQQAGRPGDRQHDAASAAPGGPAPLDGDGVGGQQEEVGRGQVVGLGSRGGGEEDEQQAVGPGQGAPERPA